MVNNPVYRIVVRNRWGNPIEQFVVEAPPIEDSFEYVKNTLIKKSLKIECRGINGVTFVRRNIKEEENSMKVMIVEDDELTQKMFEKSFRGYDLIQAYTLDQAEELFRSHFHTLNVIVVDGCVMNTGNCFDSEPFLRRIIATKFDRPIIAISGNENVRQEMLKVGATHECEKHELKNKIRELGLI